MEAPTLERLRHAPGYDAPERTQTVSRVAYRMHTPFEAMTNRGDLTRSQFEAARKLTKHYIGTMGVRVGNGDAAHEAHDVESEEAQYYHGQMVADAAKVMLAAEFRALVTLIDESGDLESIGRNWLGCKQRGQAHIAGKSLVITGLERLALHWRIKQRDP